MAIINTAELWDYYQIQIKQDNHYEHTPQSLTPQRALECAIAEQGELLDSMGAPWWKERFDRGNILVEAVDILKFLLIAAARHQMQEGHDVKRNLWGSFPVLFFYKGGTSEKHRKLALKIISETVSLALNQPKGDDFRYGVGRIYAMLMELIKAYGFSEDEFRTAFDVKTYLNIFRNNHGYSQGSYVKTVYEIEDNVAAANIYHKGMSYAKFEKLMLEAGYGNKNAK